MQTLTDPSTADGTINCSGALYNGSNVCASDSLTSNIIIRCSNGTGYAGNCNDEFDLSSFRLHK